MSNVLDRLTDAMDAAAATVRDEELHPLVAPSRRWHQPAWLAPAAAAVAVVLVIGLAIVVSHGTFGTLRASGPEHFPAAPHRFYIATSISTGQTMVRSTATGRAVEAVPVSVPQGWSVDPVLATAADGTFYLAAFERGVSGERIYRFRLTSAGHVTGFARVPGGTLRPGWAVDMLAPSPDGSLVAVGVSYYSKRYLHGDLYRQPQRSDQIAVINTVSRTQRTWRGGSLPGYKYFRAGGLSWTAGGRELAVFGQWCRDAVIPGGQTCQRGQRQAQLRAIDPARGSGGSVLDGRLLLRQSAALPFLAQALISPDGSVITAVVLRGQVVGHSGAQGYFPQDLSVERISAATGRLLGVLYQRRMGDTSVINTVPNPLALSSDATGRNLILLGGICGDRCTDGFNGWLHDGRLIPFPPAGAAHREASETW